MKTVIAVLVRKVEQVKHVRVQVPDDFGAWPARKSARAASALYALVSDEGWNTATDAAAENPEEGLHDWSPLGVLAPSCLTIYVLDAHGVPKELP